MCYVYVDLVDRSVPVIMVMSKLLNICQICLKFSQPLLCGSNAGQPRFFFFD